MPISDEIVVLVTWTAAPSLVTSWSFLNVYQSSSISRGTTFLGVHYGGLCNTD